MEGEADGATNFTTDSSPFRAKLSTPAELPETRGFTA